MKKLFAGLLLLISQLATAQSVDEHIGTLLNERRWFDLQRELQIVTPANSLSPMLYTFSTAMVKHYFNQPKTTCQPITVLLNHYQQEIGVDNVLNMVNFLGVNLSRQGLYKEAAELEQSLVNQLKALQADSAQIIALQKIINAQYMPT